MKAILICVGVIALVVGFALRPTLAGSWQMWAAFGVGYGALGAWAYWDLKQRDLLEERLRPKGGDISIGVLLGIVLVLVGVLAQRTLAPPGSPQAEWMFRIVLQLGSVSPALVGGLASIVFLEELVWRGLVLEHAKQRFGTRWALPISAGAYALAHLPTCFTLGSETAGPNPLLFLAALGGGLAWSFAAVTWRRLWPCVVSHWVFAYFSISPLPLSF